MAPPLIRLEVRRLQRLQPRTSSMPALNLTVARAIVALRDLACQLEQSPSPEAAQRCSASLDQALLALSLGARTAPPDLLPEIQYVLDHLAGVQKRLPLLYK